MAIVHVAFKSSSKAPPAAAHAQYIARDGQYEKRGGVELVESVNMPEFAREHPHAFWAAADAHERANGRAYTEIQILSRVSWTRRSAKSWRGRRRLS